MRFNDAIFGIVLIAFALAEIAYARTFPRLHGQDYGPDLFPTIIGAGLIICGIILIWQGWAKRSSYPMMAVDDWAQDQSTVVNVVLMLGSIIAYILFANWLGFIPMSLLILTLLLVRLGASWFTSVAVAVATTFIIHTLFAKILLVPLPWGIMLPVAW